MDAKLEQELGEPLNEETQVYGIIAPFLRGVNTDVNATLTHTSISPSSCSIWSATLSSARASAVSTG